MEIFNGFHDSVTEVLVTFRRNFADFLVFYESRKINFLARNRPIPEKSRQNLTINFLRLQYNFVFSRKTAKKYLRQYNPM